MSATPLSIPPTMIRCVLVLFLSVSSVVLGEGVSSATGAPPPALPGSNTNTEHKILSGFCFFRVIPSASCRFQCHLKNKDAHCDEVKNMCLCTSNDEEEVDSGEVFGTQRAPIQPQLTVAMHPVTVTSDKQHILGQSTESKHHAVFYIFDLKNVFGQKQGAQEASTTVEVDNHIDSSQDQPEDMAVAGWNFQDLLAFLILILLAVLVVLEIYTFYKKRTTKNLADNLANAIIIPSKM